MHFTRLHGIHAFIMLHGLHCIQSGSTWPHCMESTALIRDPFPHAAWNPLHSIGIHCTTLHGIHCIQSVFIEPRCMESTAFNHASWNPPHSIMLHGIHYIQSGSIVQATWNPLHSIMLHGIQCIQLGCIEPCCMEVTSFNRDALSHPA